jgi:hypothetical protein
MEKAANCRVGATYNIRASVIGSRMTSENWQPMARVNDNPSRRIRRQFQSTTSRGAYKVCDTAMAVKIAPKEPHAAPISGCVSQSVLFRRMRGEKQYNVRAM